MAGENDYDFDLDEAQKWLDEFKSREAEYLKRLVPASDEEIVALAERLWADPALRAAFERVGYDGDFTDEEEAALDAAIDAYRQGPMWNRDHLHLLLAPCLVRQFAAGLISRIDGPQTREFLADRKVRRYGAGYTVVNTPTKEVMDFAMSMLSTAEIRSIFEDVKDDKPFTEDQLLIIKNHRKAYEKKLGLFNRAALGVAVPLLRKISAGEIKDFDSPEAWQIIRNSHLVKG